MSDYEHTIVCGILQRPMRIADVSRLRLDYFQERETKALFALTRSYHEKRKRRNVMDLALARAKLEESRSKIAPFLLSLLDEYEELDPITEPEFREALEQLVNVHREDLLKRHGAAALEAMVDGDFGEARGLMRQAILEADDADLEDDRPVDIRSAASVEAERARIERPPERDDSAGFDVGFPRLMRAVKFRRKELTILGGYAADGKTQFSKTLVSNANQNGANVLYVALEMTTEEVRAMFIAQHCARLDPRGVPWVEAMDGHLNAGQKKLWHRALDEFEVTRHEDHEEVEGQAGKLIIWAPTRRITQADWVTRMRAAKQEDDVAIGVKDYTELVKPTPKKGFANYRLDLKEMIEEDKALARELDVWVIDNHQISRKGRDDAEKRKPPHYLKRDLGESSGLERAADHVLWVYSDHDLKDDRQAIVGIAKARKGNEIVHGIRLFADFAKSNMAPIAADIA